MSRVLLMSFCMVMGMSCASDNIRLTIVAPEELSGAILLAEGQQVGRFDSPAETGGAVFATIVVPRTTSVLEVQKAGYHKLTIEVPKTQSTEAYVDIQRSQLEKDQASGRRSNTTPATEPKADRVE